MNEILFAMLEFLTSNIDTILGFITGGGLLSLFTFKYTRSQAKADAMKSIQDVYQETIIDLRTDKDEMKKEISELRLEVHQNTKDINILKSYKCTVMDCKLRKRD